MTVVPTHSWPMTSCASSNPGFQLRHVLRSDGGPGIRLQKPTPIACETLAWFHDRSFAVTFATCSAVLLFPTQSGPALTTAVRSLAACAKHVLNEIDHSPCLQFFRVPPSMSQSVYVARVRTTLPTNLARTLTSCAKATYYANPEVWHSTIRMPLTPEPALRHRTATRSACTATRFACPSLITAWQAPLPASPVCCVVTDAMNVLYQTCVCNMCCHSWDSRAMRVKCRAMCRTGIIVCLAVLLLPAQCGHRVTVCCPTLSSVHQTSFPVVHPWHQLSHQLHQGPRQH